MPFCQKPINTPPPPTHSSYVKSKGQTLHVITYIPIAKYEHTVRYFLYLYCIRVRPLSTHL